MSVMLQAIEELRMQIQERQAALQSLERLYGATTAVAVPAAPGMAKVAEELTQDKMRLLTGERKGPPCAGKKAEAKPGRQQGLAAKVREAVAKLQGPFTVKGVMKAMGGRPEFTAVNGALWRLTTSGEIVVKVHGAPGKPATYVKKGEESPTGPTGPTGGTSQAKGGEQRTPNAELPTSNSERNGKEKTVVDMVWELVCDEKQPYTTRLVLSNLEERHPTLKKKITEGIYHAMSQLEAMGRIERNEEGGVKGWRTPMSAQTNGS